MGNVDNTKETVLLGLLHYQDTYIISDGGFWLTQGSEIPRSLEVTETLEITILGTGVLYRKDPESHYFRLAGHAVPCNSSAQKQPSPNRRGRGPARP